MICREQKEDEILYPWDLRMKIKYELTPTLTHTHGDIKIHFIG